MNEIEEGNKTIAIFMGAKYFESWKNEKYHWPNAHYYFDDDSLYLKDKVKESLEYHSDWSWLIPVVQEIGKRRGIDGIGCTLNYLFDRLGKKEWNDFNTIEDLWSAIVEFIKCLTHNKNEYNNDHPCDMFLGSVLLKYKTKMNLLEFKTYIIEGNICVVDEKAQVKIKKGDAVFTENGIEYALQDGVSFKDRNEFCFPILASTSSLPNLPRLIIKDEAERLCEVAYNRVCKTRPENAELASRSMVYPFSFSLGFNEGFRANKNNHTDEDMIAFAKFVTNKYNQGHSTKSALKEYGKSKSTTLLIPCDSSGNPIINENNEIIGYKK